VSAALSVAWAHLPAWLRKSLDPFHTTSHAVCASGDDDEFVHWRRGSDTATLDGRFTAAQLHDIAAMMEKEGE
jgi:hypothetical protein